MSGISILLLLLKIISVPEAIEGFTSPSILAIGVLFVVAKGLENVGTVEVMLESVLGQPSSISEAIFRISFPVAIASAFMNNTPVVAMMIPVVERWALRTGHPVSKLLIPLSFSSMLGGMCTLLGTSTNLILSELASDYYDIDMFTMSPVGVPLMVLGILFMGVFSCLMPTREDPTSRSQVAMPYKCSLVCTKSATNKSLGDVGLTVVPGAQLVSHTRSEKVVHGEEIHDGLMLQKGDRLDFMCTADAIPDLRKFREVLLKQEPDLERLGPGRRHRKTFEAVLDTECLLVGETPDSRDIPDLYNCVILSHRAVELSSLRQTWISLTSTQGPGRESSVDNPVLDSSSGEVGENEVGSKQRLEIGDSVVIEAYPSFLKTYENTKHFSVIRTLKGLTPRHAMKKDLIRSYIAGIILLMMVVLASLQDYLGYSIFVMALVASALLIMTQCLTVDEALGAIKRNVIFAIVATYGLGNAMQNTGVSAMIARALVAFGAKLGSIGMLILLYICTAVLSCLVSNQATVILLWPVVVDIVEGGGFEGELGYGQFAIVLMMGASTAFATPIGYQTNLMVYGPGNYAFQDFLKMGGALSAFLAVCGGVLTNFIIKS